MNKKNQEKACPINYYQRHPRLLLELDPVSTMAMIPPVDDSSLVEVVQSEGDLRRIEPAENFVRVIFRIFIFIYNDQILEVFYGQRVLSQNRIQDIPCTLTTWLPTPPPRCYATTRT
jgi:hypothetical protein